MIQERQSTHLVSRLAVPKLDIDHGLFALASSPAACTLCVNLATIKGASSLLRSRVLSLLCAPGHSVSVSLLHCDGQTAFARLCF